MGPLLLLLLAASAAAITNSPNQDSEVSEFTQINQYQPFAQQLTRNGAQVQQVHQQPPQQQQQLTRSILSPQQQTNILSDVQQHRFQIAVPPDDGARDYQRPRANNIAFPQQYNRQYDQYNSPTQQFNTQQFNAQQFNDQQNRQQFQPSFPQQQQFAQATYNQRQVFQQPPVDYNRQTDFRPSQISDQLPEPPRPANNFQANQYESSNYVAPQTHDNSPPLGKISTKQQSQQFQQYLSEVPQANRAPIQLPYVPQPYPQLVTDKPEPTYILETQPPTPYRKQKPLEAITFSTESYQTPPTTSAPTTRRVPLKVRQRPTKQPPREDKNAEIYLKQERQKLYQQIVSTPQSAPKASPRPTKATTPAAPTKTDEELIQEELQRQLQDQLLDKDNPFKTLKVTLPGSLSPDQIANLPQLAGLGDAFETQGSSGAYLGPSADAGPKIKVVHAPKAPEKKRGPEIRIIHQNAPPAPTTTVKPPEVLFEELTKGVLPPGADFELIRQKQDGGLEEVQKLQNLPQKKVTFVILEEQPDGSVKVQGVRGNNENESPAAGAPDVDSIIEKIKKGEIKLPPSTKLTSPSKTTPTPLRTVTPQESVASPSYVKHTGKPAYAKPAKQTNIVYETSKRKPAYSTTVSSSGVANSHAGPIFALADYSASTTAVPSTEPPYRLKAYSRKPSSRPVFLPTVPAPLPEEEVRPVIHYAPTPRAQPPPTTTTTTTTSTTPAAPEPDKYQNHRRTPPPQERDSLVTLNEVFKSHGLFAMAKFLRQSGLDRVLNETGPYTIFVPTDRAFRSLLVQLGGPDRAEQKFRQNPRLLSGLLLHHVIPGAFRLDSLQDEMTGVSLAGTQLRVNTYTTQDLEWNDLKVVTINGARVVREASDIEVPQGIAHAVDRVMFPLPVGDIIQTLQADRENRFSKFIRILEETGVATSLTGSKTYTVFAPTNDAFPGNEDERLLEQRASARALALRHITPGTLYSAGMLYYQLRDTMNNGKQITLFKEAGRVKANNAHVVTRNIPATNGVIHAIDSLL